MISTLVYSVRFALFFGAEWAFFYWIPWIACHPIPDLQKEKIVPGAIPANATCYTVDHGAIVFRYYRSFADVPIPYILTAALLLGLIAIFFWPWFWMRSDSASKPGGGVAETRATAPAEATTDPFAASKATTYRQLALVFWQRFGPGPLLLLAAIAVFGILTIAPPLAPYRGFLFFAGPAAGMALLLGRPNVRKSRREERDAQ